MNRISRWFKGTNTWSGSTPFTKSPDVEKLPIKEVNCSCGGMAGLSHDSSQGPALPGQNSLYIWKSITKICIGHFLVIIDSTYFKSKSPLTKTYCTTGIFRGQVEQSDTVSEFDKSVTMRFTRVAHCSPAVVLLRIVGKYFLNWARHSA